MNKDEFSGNWKNLQGKIKEKWGKITDDDLMRIEGKRDQLIGTLQKRYGYEKDRAERELSEWEDEHEMEWEEEKAGLFSDKDETTR